jgi:hypothetical protein
MSALTKDRTRADQEVLVRVNLLPAVIDEQRGARRIAIATGLLVVIFAALLGGLHTARQNEIREAEAQRDMVQGQVAQLQAEVAQLQQFRQLADELEARNAVLAFAMGKEVSFARVFNDLALGFPDTASMERLSVAMAEPAEPAPGSADFGDAIGSVAYEGYSTERYAPGVEAVLVEFAKIRSFFHTYLSTAERERIEGSDTTIHLFSGSAQLDDQSYTRRYEGGLPQEVAP